MSARLSARLYAVVALLIVVLAPVLAAAQDKPASASAAAALPEEPYQPSLSDIMARQQMRHIKLWFAGHGANWPLADYEIGELKDGFDDVARLLGGDIVDQHVGAGIAAVEQAVEGKDASAFTAAFDRLTAGCNACHHDLDHGFIVIGRPASLPYSDQLFAPRK
jgi:hypothetical protein